MAVKHDRLHKGLLYPSILNKAWHGGNPTSTSTFVKSMLNEADGSINNPEYALSQLQGNKMKYAARKTASEFGSFAELKPATKMKLAANIKNGTTFKQFSGTNQHIYLFMRLLNVDDMITSAAGGGTPTEQMVMFEDVITSGSKVPSMDEVVYYLAMDNIRRTAAKLDLIKKQMKVDLRRNLQFNSLNARGGQRLLDVANRTLDVEISREIFSSVNMPAIKNVPRLAISNSPGTELIREYSRLVHKSSPSRWPEFQKFYNDYVESVFVQRAKAHGIRGEAWFMTAEGGLRSITRASVRDYSVFNLD